jgi:hypothetical protein
MPARPALAALLVCGAAALCAAPSASARTTIKPGVYKLAIPAPGHVSVGALEVTVQKHGHGAPPTSLSLTMTNRFGLPDSVRFFYARRRISTAPLRYELLLLAVNRESGKAATQARAAKTEFNAGSIVLQYPTRSSSAHGCGNCAKRLPRSTNCKSCWFKRTAIRQVQAVNADVQSASELGPLVALLRAGWTNNGDSNTVFGNPSTGAPRDRTVDSGYYDDHRAFGWDRASLRDPKPVLKTVVDDLLTGQQTQIVPALELLAQADLNGNGVLDSSTAPGGGSPAA